MNSFYKLPISKQEKILNAAFDEFAEQGYEKASTNKIVKKAGIGKGMLFYYFKSKQDLFYYLINYSIDYIKKYYLNLIDENETDFLEKYKNVALVKLKAYTDNPHVFNFLGNFYLNKEVIFPKNLLKKIADVRALAYKKLYHNIDTSLFKDNIDKDKIIELITWIFEGYENKVIKYINEKNLFKLDVNLLFAEFYEYLEIIKKLFYK